MQLVWSASFLSNPVAACDLMPVRACTCSRAQTRARVFIYLFVIFNGGFKVKNKKKVRETVVPNIERLGKLESFRARHRPPFPKTMQKDKLVNTDSKAQLTCLHRAPSLG